VPDFIDVKTKKSVKVNDVCPHCKDAILIEDLEDNGRGMVTLGLFCSACERVIAVACTVRVKELPIREPNPFKTVAEARA
jgi:hypothetical protein